MPTIEFKGKSFVQNHHLAVPFHQLVPDKKKSLTDNVSLHDNLIIHGDNLIALKALLPTYAGKVKCIYIDPPYNTGNEGWVYNDKVNSPIIKEWIGHVVGKEGEDLTRHDKWLCMMMPRLKLLRELLADDGAIFISIDYNEEHNLRILMNEIFGESNFRNIVSVSRVKKNIQEKELMRALNFGYDSVMFYSKSDSCLLVPPKKTQKKLERWHAFDAPGVRPTMEYDLFGYKPPRNRHWMYEEARANEMIAKGLLRMNPTSLKPQYKLEESNETLIDTNWTDIQESSSKWNFPNGEKNVDFIRRILKLVFSKEQNAIILDSFAGSGTTAQAVLELNKEDGGNRKFILVEMEDYADNITAERVRRVIKGVPNSKNELLKQGVGGTFSYFDLGDPIEISSILSGKTLPTYLELARYVYYTATGEEFNDSNLNESKNYIGKSMNYDIYMYYKPDIEYLKTTALTLDESRNLRKKAGKRPLLVFAPTKYVEQTELDNLQITFCQLPFEIYKVKG